MAGLRIAELRGAAVAARLDALAALRIAVFREFPYLYEGSLDYERGYLAGFARSSRSTLIIAEDGPEVVGASTAMPLLEHGDAPALSAPLASAGVDPAGIYYFGESVLLPAYRGRGVGGRFMDLREAAARRHGFREVAFCSVLRADDHPARPPGYRGNDALWTRRGFRKRSDILARMRWRDVGERDESEKVMVFWTRELPP